MWFFFGIKGLVHRAPYTEYLDVYLFLSRSDDDNKQDMIIVEICYSKRPPGSRLDGRSRSPKLIFLPINILHTLPCSLTLSDISTKSQRFVTLVIKI